VTNTIIRSPRRQRFVIVDQRAIEDATLSWAARGLLAYLLSRPDDWKVLVGDLKRRGNLGRDGIYKLLRELRDTGYIHYQAHRGTDGRLRGGTYFVSETPLPPHPDLPDPALPETASPDPVKPEALLNKDFYKKLTKPTTTTNKQGPGRSSGSNRVEFADWVPIDLRGSAERAVAPLEPSTAQTVVDEWAGAIAAGSIDRSLVGYLVALVARCQAGDFVPKLADGVAAERSGRFSKPTEGETSPTGMVPANSRAPEHGRR